MTTLYTIGFTKKSLRGFVALLQEAGVDVIVDTRLRNNSQLSGYAKRDDLAFVMELLGIAYEHHPDLAPTAEILDTYRKEKDWSRYVRKFNPLITERDIQTIGHNIFQRYNAPCLLCSEATHEHCHRSLVAEYWTKHIPNLEVIHL